MACRDHAEYVGKQFNHNTSGTLKPDPVTGEPITMFMGCNQLITKLRGKALNHIVQSQQKGQALICGNLIMIANPNSPAQQEIRTNFSEINRIAAGLDELLQSRYHATTPGRTNRQEFIRDNLHKPFTHFTFTKGTLHSGNVRIQNMSIQPGAVLTLQADLTWSNLEGLGNTSGNDFLRILTVNLQEAQFTLFSPYVLRHQQQALVTWSQLADRPTLVAPLFVSPNSLDCSTGRPLAFIDAQNQIHYL